MIQKFEIDGLLLIDTKSFMDDRGLFFESFNQEKFNEIVNCEVNFVQDNVSESKKNVIRGLHFQNPPYEQGKLVRVLSGKVIDVAVDIRKNSLTYGKHVSVELSKENKKMFWIPPGFAHGFAVLEDNTIFSYKCTNYYNKQSEGDLFWNDKELNIDWGIDHPILSQKDQDSQVFIELESKF
jgi:dTDP-4-dehydrorhamnose 3,5-epimerase